MAREGRAHRRRRTVGRALADAGFIETLCYPFVGAGTLDPLRIPAGDPRRDMVLLRNPLSDEEPALRTTLLPGLLATLRRNDGRGTVTRLSCVCPAEASRNIRPHGPSGTTTRISA